MGKVVNRDGIDGSVDMVGGLFRMRAVEASRDGSLVMMPLLLMLPVAYPEEIGSSDVISQMLPRLA